MTTSGPLNASTKADTTSDKKARASPQIEDQIESPDLAQSINAPTFNPAALTPGQVMHLQRTIGNRATAELLKRTAPPAPQSKTVPHNERQIQRQEDEGTKTSVISAAPAPESKTVPRNERQIQRQEDEKGRTVFISTPPAAVPKTIQRLGKDGKPTETELALEAQKQVAFIPQIAMNIPEESEISARVSEGKALETEVGALFKGRPKLAGTLAPVLSGPPGEPEEVDPEPDLGSVIGREFEPGASAPPTPSPTPPSPPPETKDDRPYHRMMHEPGMSYSSPSSSSPKPAPSDIGGGEMDTEPTHEGFDSKAKWTSWKGKAGLGKMGVEQAVGALTGTQRTEDVAIDTAAIVGDTVGIFLKSLEMFFTLRATIRSRKHMKNLDEMAAEATSAGADPKVVAAVKYAMKQKYEKSIKKGIAFAAAAISTGGAITALATGAAVVGALTLLTNPVGWGVLAILTAGVMVLGLGGLIFKVFRNLWKRGSGTLGTKRTEMAALLYEKAIEQTDLTALSALVELGLNVDALLESSKVPDPSPKGTKDQRSSLERLKKQKVAKDTTPDWAEFYGGKITETEAQIERTGGTYKQKAVEMIANKLKSS